MAQGTVVGLPTSSPLMKLASRPKNSPIGVAAAHTSSMLQTLALVRRAKYDDGEDGAEQAAVECHAAHPHGRDVERVGEEVARLVEQHIAEPAAHKHAHGHIDEQVVHLRRRERGLVAGPQLRAARAAA